MISLDSGLRRSDERGFAQIFPRKSKDPCADLKRKLKERTVELKESREQQAAVSDILRVISATATDVKPVLRSIAEHAMRLCQSRDARIWLVEGDKLKYVTGCGGIAPVKEGDTMPIDRRSGPGRAVVDRKAIHIRDAAIVSEAELPLVREMQRRHGHRTVVIVPLMSEKRAVGTIVLRKMIVEPFTKRQIDLVRTFADQAAIAIENVRLFKELQARNAEITEALEQQTATAEILKVISSSPTDTQPVFDAIVKSGIHLFGGANVSLRLVKGDQIVQVASTLAVDRFAVPVNDESFPVVRAILRRETVNIADMSAEEWINEEARRRAKRRGNRAIAHAPMMRGNDAIGVIAVTRATPGLFTDKEIALLKTFADQAVIAIENVRLFKELQARNAEVTEALEQQTATSEILGAISRSPTDVMPVFETLMKNAANLCGSPMAAIFRFDGELVHLAATHNWPAEALAELDRCFPTPPNPALISGRVILSRSVVRESDALSDPNYDRALATKGKWRRVLGVPLLRDGEPIGAINLAWPDPGETPEGQVALLKTFADQAVIAIENVRLFKELQAKNADLTEALEQQTASAEILRIISSSPATLDPVFSSILKSALRLCEAGHGILFLYDGDALAIAAHENTSPALVEHYKAQPRMYPTPDRGPSSRAALERRVVHILDLQNDPSFRLPPHLRSEGLRTALAVPILLDDKLFGVITVYRREVMAFSSSQINLVRTFADQAVIAIENVRLFRETKEALEQQTVISEILRVISSSPTDTQPVFDAIVKSGVQLFGGMTMSLRLIRADHTVTVASTTPVRDDTGGEFPVPLADMGVLSSRAIARREVVQVADLLAAEDWVSPLAKKRAELRGYRALMCAPMLREGKAIGTVNVSRATPGLFTDKQIALLKTFADQAVIAIENVRLFKELQARNADLTEALEQQTATGEILRVISGSPTDVQPVLDAVAQSAAHLCVAHDARIFRAEGETLRCVACYGSPMENQTLPVTRLLPAGRAVLDGETTQIDDIAAVLPDLPEVATRALGLGVRTILATPLLREGQAIGVLVVRRMEVRPFSEKQIALLKTFADQAVIAIENVRLFRETKEALEQQTVISEILRVISSSPTDTQPVFDAIVKSGVHLFGGLNLTLRLVKGDHQELVASTLPVLESSGVHRFPLADELSPGSQAILKREIVQIPDIFAQSVPEILRRRAEQGGFRSLLTAPLLREGKGIGAIQVLSPKFGPFTDKQIALLQTFADQAVIAIENVRLFKELQARNAEITEALEQQTATAEILKVISSSPTNLQPVFDAILENATRLCDAHMANLELYDGDTRIPVAQLGGSAEYAKWVMNSGPLRIVAGTNIARMIAGRRPIQIADLRDSSEYRDRRPNTVALVEMGGARTYIVVPMVKEGRVVGGITVYRPEVRPFTQKQIDLVSTFASQAVIAIENVRLFNETKEALEQQTVISEILRVISSSPTDTQPVFDAIVKSGGRLFGGMNVTLRLVRGAYTEPVASTLYLGEAERYPVPLSEGSPSARAILRKEVVQVHDMVTEDWVDELSRQRANRRGFRSFLSAPLVREDVAVGVINVLRASPGAFTDKQVALLKTFADQAVIAIENVRLFKELEAKNADLTEALEQQTATADILRVISSSPTDIQPVLNAVAESAARLCGASDVVIRRVDGDVLRVVAHFGSVPVVADAVAVTRGTVSGCAVLERRTIHHHDILEAYARGDYPEGPSLQRGTAYRTMLVAPLLRENMAIGTIVIRRFEVRPFPDKQIKLLETFADQAVIAIENVRLFKELQARNAEITEALEQQTATAEILKVISSSPTDTQPVFDAIVKSGVHLFGGVDVALRLAKGNQITTVASTRPRLDADGQFPVRLNDDRVPSSRAMLRREAVQIPDIFAEDAAEWVGETFKQRAERRGYRAILSAPMLRENNAIGAIVVTRATSGPFTDKQIALLKTFADQAVIAIENVRLFKELQARNADLTEALEQQTATAEILKVISSSPTNLQPVFDAILENATRLCGAHMGNLGLYDGEKYQSVAQRGANAEYAKWVIDRGRFQPTPTSGIGRMIAERQPIHTPDIRQSPTYRDRNPNTVAMVELGGARTYITVPMLKEGRVVGSITIYRPEVRPFTQKQIDLVTTFANQAVIAIENVRLFNETKEALEQQTATAEILKVISSSPTDVQPVFDAIVQSAVRLFHGKWVRLFLVEGDRLYMRAYHGPAGTAGEELIHSLALHDSVIGQAILNREALQIPDYEAPGIPDASTLRSRASGIRSTSIAPLMRKGEAIGAITVPRAEPGELSEKQMSLLKTFADQAVIAIENVRLFNEIQDKSRQLEIANKHKSDFLANMSHELRTPLNAIIGFSEMLLARMFGETNAKQEEFLRDIHSSGEHLLSLINDILDLSKIEAGRMELNLKVIDPAETLENTVTLVKERAARRGITVKLEVDERLDKWVADERKIRQIMLNLLSNALKFTPEGGEISVKAAREGGNMAVAVSDTGIGIKPEDQALIFEEFQQAGSDYTKKAEGTGLGLALTRKFVELHGGTIRVESEEGKGSTFTFTVPERQEATT